ncbi:unnamed protein product [Gongylonema pulchrum]|uniref:COesterase domain-containing protein n=1 Tax=Gongylonema pulchrum TaxID=637853 RepID=A0A183EQN0_9BILA|nr:unnamed protein product [Gongylonema pulchrum]
MSPNEGDNRSCWRRVAFCDGDVADGVTLGMLPVPAFDPVSDPKLPKLVTFEPGEAFFGMLVQQFQ